MNHIRLRRGDGSMQGAGCRVQGAGWTSEAADVIHAAEHEIHTHIDHSKNGRNADFLTFFDNIKNLFISI